MCNQKKIEDEDYDTTFSGRIAIITPIERFVCVLQSAK
jgi:hypothetical protein